MDEFFGTHRRGGDLGPVVPQVHRVEPGLHYRRSAILAPVVSASTVLRDSRRLAGLSQVELARRAGVSQSVVSAYESGARQPSVPMLERLVAATGFELELTARAATQGPLGERLRQHRERVHEIAARHRLSNVRVFGSVARGDEGAHSDIDLLVDVAPGVGLFELARCRAELEGLLDARVDLVPAADLKAGIAGSVTSDARRL